MLENFSRRARDEAFREIEYCIPILAEKLQSVSMRHPKLKRTFEHVLKNERIVPRRMMWIAPYFLPVLARSVRILLGKEKMRQYETEVEIYRQLLLAYLKQDVEEILHH